MPINRVVLYPYKVGSESARLISFNLRPHQKKPALRVKPNGRYKSFPSHLVINWGSSVTPTWMKPFTKIINKPENVRVASNKLLAFQKFKEAGISTPEWTTSRETAIEWRNDGHTVVARHMLNSHSGRGIVIYEAGSDTPIAPAPLYVKYKKKKQEFRVHVFQGKILDVLEKRKRNLSERPDNFNAYIRNHANGWVYCREDVQEPADLRGLAIDATRALSLDFGAVDIIFNGYDNRCYCLEVNTAPGLVGTSIERYTTAILNCMKGNA